METLIKTIEGIEGREGKIYWINALVNTGMISKGKAGYLKLYFKAV